MNAKMEDVAVPFTGGKDSTLVAMLMCEQFKRVHLLTFVNSLTGDVNKSKVNVKKLRDIFGENRIIHRIINIDDLFKELYMGKYLPDLKKYKTLLAGSTCLSCSLAMVVHTIIYCIKNNIHFVRDGLNKTGFIFQDEFAQRQMKDFYKEYGIDYECPAYGINRTDLELFKLGMTFKKLQILYSSQPVCKGGGDLRNIYFRCYYLPRYGRKKCEMTAIRWNEDKMDFCREYVCNYLEKPKQEWSKKCS